MRNDDELVGMEDIQAFELELLRRRQQIFHSQSDWESESGALSEPMLKSRDGIRMKAEPDTAGATLETAAVSEIVEEPPSRQTPEPVLDTRPDSDTPQSAPDATQLAPDAEPEPPVCPSSRYPILPERLMGERRYADLVKSVNDSQLREQLYEEYRIALQDTAEQFEKEKPAVGIPRSDGWSFLPRYLIITLLYLHILHCYDISQC